LGHETIRDKNRQLIHGRLPFPYAHLPILGNISHCQIEQFDRGIVVAELSPEVG